VTPVWYFFLTWYPPHGLNPNRTRLSMSQSPATTSNVLETPVDNVVLRPIESAIQVMGGATVVASLGVALILILRRSCYLVYEDIVLIVW